MNFCLFCFVFGLLGLPPRRMTVVHSMEKPAPDGLIRTPKSRTVEPKYILSRFLDTPIPLNSPKKALIERFFATTENETKRAAANDEINLIPNDNNEKSYYSFPERFNVKEFLKGGNTFY